MAIAQQRLKSLSIQFKIKQLHIKNIAWNSFILLFCYVRFKNCRISRAALNSFVCKLLLNWSECFLSWMLIKNSEGSSSVVFCFGFFWNNTVHRIRITFKPKRTKERTKEFHAVLLMRHCFCYQDSYLLHSNNTCRFKKSHKQTQIMKFFVFLKSMKSTTQNSFVSSLFCTFPGKRFHFSSWNSYQFGNIQNYSLVLCLYL